MNKDVVRETTKIFDKFRPRMSEAEERAGQRPCSSRPASINVVSIDHSHVQLRGQRGQGRGQPAQVEHPLGADNLEVSGVPLHDVAQRLCRVELRDEAFVVPRLVGATAQGCRNV